MPLRIFAGGLTAPSRCEFFLRLRICTFKHWTFARRPHDFLPAPLPQTSAAKQNSRDSYPPLSVALSPQDVFAPLQGRQADARTFARRHHDLLLALLP
jgi:hypothetical protein